MGVGTQSTTGDTLNVLGNVRVSGDVTCAGKYHGDGSLLTNLPSAGGGAANLFYFYRTGAQSLPGTGPGTGGVLTLTKINLNAVNFDSLNVCNTSSYYWHDRRKSFPRCVNAVGLVRAMTV